ncbi:MAG: SGNH/GDSL hydrolase family protein [Muribaculaceae bacterium]|nr:SGNH/GDSL hydrolase family protein [Muribaculaceae bacterium]
MNKNFIKKIGAIASAILISAGSLVSAQVKTSVSILGDSYSTFENYIEPKGNEIWYFRHPKPNRTDVDDVKQTWWHLLIKENGYKLEKNNSYSGSTICTTGYRGEDYSDRAFITRMDNLGNPDILLIFGATNDSWANAPIGEFVWADWTDEQLKSFRPALTYMLSYIVDRYPNTELLYIINDGLKPEITNSIVEACDHYGVPYIQLKDIDKTASHPNIHGMKQIAEQVSAVLK